jgi:hypothetical protein
MCLELSLRDALSSALMAVESCSKGIFAVLPVHGKSPCFSQCCFSGVVGVDCALLVFASVDVEEFSECAF